MASQTTDVSKACRNMLVCANVNEEEGKKIGFDSIMSTKTDRLLM